MKTYQFIAALQVLFPFEFHSSRSGLYLPASQVCICVKCIIKAAAASRSSQMNRRSYREHHCSGDGQRPSPRSSLSS